MKNSAVLAFDIGGTDIKAAAALTGPKDGGRLVGLQRVRTPRDAKRPGEAVMEAVAGLAAGYREQHTDLNFTAAGLVVPGIVDEKAGIGVYSANLGWRNFPFGAEARRFLGLPVAFGHDVSAAGLAELRRAPPARTGDALVLVIGTGIAGAIFSNGKPVRSGGYAGEIGHALVPDPDRVGGTVILESVASAAAVSLRYSALSGRTPTDSRQVSELMERGDPIALRVWQNCIDALAFSIGQVAAILAPEVLVIGGGLAQAGPLLFEPLERRIAETKGLLRLPRLVPAALGPEAGLIGAAMMAHEAGEAA